MTPRILAASVGSLLLILFNGCGTDPVGVEACRKIEQARCEAAVECGTIEDAAACKRFFRDHCLHGVGLGEEPGNVQTDRCVTAINLAGECAAKRGGRTAPITCNEKTFKEADADEICEVVEEPVRASQCSFLRQEKPEPKPELDNPASEPDAGE